MTRIQLRRDTAANWSTNNPTPAAGEPCYETDTGKLKIGDGSTAYNNLAYQGGGSTPTNMVTTDTTQTITGLKNFQPASSASYGVKAGLAVGNLRIGTDNSSSPNPVLSGEGIKIVNSSGGQIAAFSNTESIALGNGSAAMSLNCLANTVNLKAGASINYVGNLAIGTKTLKYTSATGDTTDLLAGGSGATIDDTTTSTDSVWSSNKVNTELGNKQDALPSTDVGYNINVNGTNVAGATVYFGENTSSFLAPHAKANSSNHVLNINGYSTGGSGFTMYDTVLKTNSFKYGDRTNQYEVVNKSPDNNAYMAHMAMPSDKYIDLELGASGATYTAPADGWIYIRRFSDSTNTATNAYLSVANTTSDGTVVNRIDSRAVPNDWTKQKSGLMEILIPVKKDQSYILTYRDFSAVVNDSCYFRFFYSVGSEPSS